jgi:hypothetical protein
MSTRELCPDCGKVLRTEAQQLHYRLDTMSDVISAGSPSGRVSKRTRKVVDAQIKERLFGVQSGCTGNCHLPGRVRADRIAALRSRIQTLETCCAAQLATGRQNATTRALAAVRTELTGLLDVVAAEVQP